MKAVEVSVDYGGRTLTLQTGKLAKQADASVLCRYGDTMVLVTVVASREVKENQDFFPLTVDFQEKYYAAGRIPGGFFKREARPSERATLSARLIDRPIRPLFPEDFLCETNVVATVLSTDGVNEPDIVASIAASAALHISDIPYGGPIGTCRVGRINGEFIVNIPPASLPESQCELLVSGVRSGVVMVEGASKELSETEMIDAIDFAHQAMMPIFELQEELRKKVGKEKREYPKPARDKELKTKIRDKAWPQLKKAFAIREKLARYEALANVKKALKEQFAVAEPKTKEDVARNAMVSLYFEEAKSEYARELTLDSKHRIDGRSYTDIRNIACEVGLLPRVHGSGLFTRGETQVLGTVTLGTSDDEQKIDSISGNYQKTFLLHYNFPPFSVGEARPLRPPGRREIGHGFLAERALSYVIPPKEKFPYTVRLVSEVLESNGSSSMATVCSGSMALMDAGVPIPKPVAGVAMGLIKEGEKYAVLSDILGDEDHLGDMDFKVCGTADGITAFQMDLKIGGVSREIMEEALAQARDGRLHILEKMNEAISEPRAQFSPYAPRIFTIKVKPEKVREVIGSGGKVIRSIIERTGVKIDIEDDGTVNVASADDASAQKAIEIINQIVAEPEIGRIYEGKVSRIADFGAFVEILPGTDGLCHISELEHFRVRRVEDVVKEGDVIKVKCLDVDSQGKIRLSRKALLPKNGSPDTSSGPGPTRGETSEPAAADSDAPSEAAPAEKRSVESRFEGRSENRSDARTDEPDEEENFGNRIERSSSSHRGDRGPRGDRDRFSRDRGERDRSDRGESRYGRDRHERPSRSEDRYDRPPRDRAERSDRHDRSDRPDRPDRGNDRHERSARSDDRGHRSEGGSHRSDRGRSSSGRSHHGRSSAGGRTGHHRGERNSGPRRGESDGMRSAPHRDEERSFGRPRMPRVDEPRRDLRFERDEERLPDFESGGGGSGGRRFFDEDE